MKEDAFYTIFLKKIKFFEYGQSRIHFFDRKIRTEGPWALGPLFCSAMRDIVDMPDKKANQFIMFVQQNNGVLPLSRRKLFSELSDEEVAGLEKAVNQFL